MKIGALGFLAGLVVGVTAMVVIPRFAGPYLPQALKPGTSVQGVVAAKQREPDRLLLTVRSKEGSTLVTFTKKIPEIDLLVEQTDSIVLSMTHYRPFVENPEILKVGKPDQVQPEPREDPPEPETLTTQ